MDKVKKKKREMASVSHTPS